MVISSAVVTKKIIISWKEVESKYGREKVRDDLVKDSFPFEEGHHLLLPNDPPSQDLVKW